MNLPNSTEEVGHFLGAVKFYIRFIPGCSEITKSSSVSCGCMSFSWGPEKKANFSLLIQVLSTTPLLWFTDWTKIFYIEINVRQVIIGASFIQEAKPNI